MARFPTHPRLAHGLASAAGAADQSLAADVAALLSERDPLRRGNGPAGGADIGLRIDALSTLRRKSTPSSEFDRAALRQVDRVAQQFLRLCAKSDRVRDGQLDPGQCLALAYPDRVAMRTSDDGRRYLMRNGRAALLDEADPLRGSHFLAVASVDAGRREGFIRLAAPLAHDQFHSLFEGQIWIEREVRWDQKRGDVVARLVRRLDAILLNDEAVALQKQDPVQACLLEQIRRQGLSAFFDDPHDLRARVQLMRAVDTAAEWPDFSEQALLDDLEQWLLPWLRAGEGARQLRPISLVEVLSGVLGWERMQRLDQWLPSHFDTPAGTRRRVQYGLDGAPVLALPLQEVLGLREGPTLAGGRLPLLLHLLSPAGRPLQVTTDLAAFWAGAYAEVKKEMRGRYPKHFWPDDPVDARATRFTKRRM